MTEEFKSKMLELKKAALQYFKDNYSNGGSSEFDMRTNDISQSIIRVYQKEYGTVYLGKINDYEAHENRTKAQYTVYNDPDQKIYTFCADFVIPVADEELLAILIERNTPREYSSKTNSDEVNKISARIALLGGSELTWS